MMGMIDARDISVAGHTPVHIFKFANYDHYLSDEHDRAVTSSWLQVDFHCEECCVASAGA